MCSFSLFFFNDTATTEIYTLSLHDALPISLQPVADVADAASALPGQCLPQEGGQLWHDKERAAECHSANSPPGGDQRSEEHTSELQSQSNLVCRLLLEKKKKIKHT